MKNVVYDNETYKRLFIDEDSIFKYSFQYVDAWKRLMCKSLNFLNIPTSCAHLSDEEQKKYENCLSKIYIPYLKNYSTIYKNTFLHKFDTKSILMLMRKMLISIQKMHAQKVFHGDLYAQNIMIDKNLNFCFIDLDAAIIEDIISEENTYESDDIPFEEKVMHTLSEDKLNLLNLLLYYLMNGTFDTGIDFYLDLRKLGLSKELTSELEKYHCGDYPTIDYYFVDIIDELLSIGYEPKILKK